MRRTRTTTAALSAVTLLAALAGCRGSDDDAADDTTPAQAAGDSTAPAGSAAPGDTTAASTGGDCPASSPGLSETSIKLGGTYPLSGPAAAYSAIPVGADAWFQHLNDTDGGLQLADGSTVKVEWSYLDDKYEPPKAVENVKRLVESDKVFVVLNPLGTPNNTAIRDYMNTRKVPQLFVATGASKWGKEIDQYPWTIGLQPDYESEGIAYAQFILEENPDAKIGILYQNDDFGADYLAGIEEGLGDAADQIVAEVSYEITDATIDNQVSQIQSSGANALIAIVTPKFAIQTIQRKAALGWEPEQFVMSSVSSSVGAVWEPAGGENGIGGVTSVYLKDPTDPALADDPAVVEYKEILAKYHGDANPDDGFYLYGMNMAQTFEALLEGMDGPVCRQSVMDAAKNFTFESPLLLDGISVETGPGDAFPLQQVQLQRWNGENWEKFGEVIDAAAAQ